MKEGKEMGGVLEPFLHYAKQTRTNHYPITLQGGFKARVGVILLSIHH